MPTLSRLVPFSSQPQVPVEIDWANPLTRHLFAAIVPGIGVNLVDGMPLLYGPATQNGIGKSGKCLIAADGSQSGVYFTSHRLTSAMTLMTMVSVIELTANPSAMRRQFASTGDAWNAPYQCNSMEFSNDPQLTLNGGGLYGQYPVKIGVPQTIGGVFRGASGCETWIDGHIDTISGTATPTINTQGRAGWLNFAYNQMADRAPPARGYLGLFFDIDLTRQQLASITANPWQIFKPIPRYIFAPVSAATGDGTGIGSLYAITLSSPTATAAGTANATATGSLAASTLTAPTGSASAGTSATATGTFAASSLSAPSATATGSALATGALTTVTLTTITASANGSALATGAFAASSLSAPSATATGSALATGALTTVTLTTITASANGSALATGTIDQIDLSTVAGNATGTTAGNAEGVGSVATIALSAPAASAIGSALATGSFAAISLGTVSGSASAATDGQAAASIQPISISAPLAIAIASSVATGGIQSIGLTAPTGTASGQAQTIARPTSDISNTGWTPSTGSDLYAMLDEVSPDDADYISTSSVGAVCKFGMNATAFPGGASQQLSLRASSSTGNGILVTIKDGATTIATRTLTLTPTFDLHTITLTSGEIAAITSGNLTVEMTST